MMSLKNMLLTLMEPCPLNLKKKIYYFQAKKNWRKTHPRIVAENLQGAGDSLGKVADHEDNHNEQRNSCQPAHTVVSLPKIKHQPTLDAKVLEKTVRKVTNMLKMKVFLVFPSNLFNLIQKAAKLKIYKLSFVPALVAQVPALVAQCVKGLLPR